MALMEGMMAQPVWLILWVSWLGIVNFVALAFWEQREARFVFFAMCANMLMMPIFAEFFGYTRILGLPHILTWTPLLIYLRPRFMNFPTTESFGLWLRILVVTDFASLVIDYSDVIRYLLGERAPLG